MAWPVPTKRLVRLCSASLLVIFALVFASHWLYTSPPPVAHNWQSDDNIKANPNGNANDDLDAQSSPPSSSPESPLVEESNYTIEVHTSDSLWPRWTEWTKDAWSSPVDTNTNQTFIRQLQSFTRHGHSAEDLFQLADASRGRACKTTAIIQVTREAQTIQQMEAIVAQTMPVNQVWFICTPDLKDTCNTLVEKYPSLRTKVLVKETPVAYPTGSAGRSTWLQSITGIDTAWAWIVDQGAVPSVRYLERLCQLAFSNEYHDAILGTHGTVLSANFHDKNDASDTHCFPDDFDSFPGFTLPVDMIHGAWLLRKSWLGHLITPDTRHDVFRLPLGYYISHTLLRHANVPSIILPPQHDVSLKLDSKATCDAVRTVFGNPTENGLQRLLSLRITPTVLDSLQHTIREQRGHFGTVMFVADGRDEAIALYPLVCRFPYTVHMVVTGGARGLSGLALEKAFQTTMCERVIVHDLDVTLSDDIGAARMVGMELALLVSTVRPKALIHVKTTGPIGYAVQSTAQYQNTVRIALPLADIQHALWIADLSLEAIEQWHKGTINLVVITDRRPHALSRLLQSVDSSHFLGDRVNLVINEEQSSDRVTRMMLDNFHWRHGTKTLRHRIRKGGLMPAIVEAWYPNSNDDYAVILEDDVQVSPLFYVWLKYSILQYRYSNNPDNAKLLYGVSLYSPRNLELHPAGRRSFHPDNVLKTQYPARIPYVSQVPCSWGAVYFPEHWREFHQYLSVRLLDGRQDHRLNITVPRSRSSRWKKSWKKYFIELVYLRGYVMLYPNFQSFESFSTNHVETGTHVKTVTKRLSSINAFLVPLMQRDTILDQLPHHRLPAFENLPVLDLWGYLVSHEALDATAAQWHSKVSTCSRTTGTYDPQDILCPFPPEEKPEVPPKPKKIRYRLAKEPYQYVTVYAGKENKDLVLAEQIRQEEDLPMPIDVASMPSDPDNGTIIANEELLDLESEMHILNLLYYQIHPVDLQEVLAADAEDAVDELW